MQDLEMQPSTILDTCEPTHKLRFRIPLFSRVSASHLEYLAIPLTKIQKTYTKPPQDHCSPTQKPKSQPRHNVTGDYNILTIDTGEQEREHDCEERIRGKRNAGLEKACPPERFRYNAAYSKETTRAAGSRQRARLDISKGAFTGSDDETEDPVSLQD